MALHPGAEALLDTVVDTPLQLQILQHFHEQSGPAVSARILANQICCDVWSADAALCELAGDGVLAVTCDLGEPYFHYAPLPELHDPIARLFAAYDDPLLREALHGHLRGARARRRGHAGRSALRRHEDQGAGGRPAPAQDAPPPHGAAPGAGVVACSPRSCAPRRHHSPASSVSVLRVHACERRWGAFRRPTFLGQHGRAYRLAPTERRGTPVRDSASWCWRGWRDSNARPST